jgi:phosphate-selective porin OprO/OprP
VGELDIDDDVFSSPLLADPNRSASDIFSWGVGLNWRLNQNIKLTLNYEHATLDEAPGATLPYTTEDVIFTRVQFAF